MLRKTIFLLTTLLAAGSCIRENTDGCTGDMSLVFVLEDPYSTGDYDSDIGNDIELQFFRGDLFSGSTTIPYGRIRNGQPYGFQKKCTDKVRIAAYSVPAGQSATIPSPAVGDSFFDQYLRMGRPVRSVVCAPYDGTLYLGTALIDGGVPDGKVYTVAMAPCFAKVTVVVLNAGMLGAGFSMTHEAGVEGTAASMRVSDRSAIGAAEVRAAFSDRDGVYTTGLMRILPPQAAEAGLRVNLYADGELVLYLDTGQVAVAGKEILIKIDPGNLTAEITIDGWTHKTQVVTP